jgi:hypothetical protein
MAKAQKKDIEVIQKTTVRGVTLELTIDEAHTLRDVFAKIAGCPTTSRRVHVEAISNALADIGNSFSHVRLDDMSGSIEFKKIRSPF